MINIKVSNETALLRAVVVGVADDFGGIGWYGGVAIEGLMSGLPVMSDIDNQLMSQLHGEQLHPFINVLTPSEIEEALFSLTDQAHRDSVGEFSREWAVKNHGRQKVAELFLRRLIKCGII